MKENPYFKLKEFECKCGKCELPKRVPSDELLDILCEIREHFCAPVLIKSAYRCKEHNTRVGGAKNSQHTLGSAVDFVVKGVKTLDVYDFLIQNYDDAPLGIAIKRNFNNENSGFVHLDTRGKRARWEYS